MRSLFTANRALSIDEVVEKLHPKSKSLLRKYLEERLIPMLSRLVANIRPTVLVTNLSTCIDTRQRLRADGSAVAVATRLSEDLLRGLFENRYCAVHIKNFCPRETCRQLSEWMTTEFKFSKAWEPEVREGFMESDMYYGIGLPSNFMFSSREACRNYFTQVLPTIQKIRAAAKSGIAPPDQLRLELDEVWPDGATIETLYGRKMFVGLARLMKPEWMVKGAEAEGIIHTDSSPLLNGKRGGFSANIYVKVPATGGELCVWNIAPRWLDLLRSSRFFNLLEQVFLNDGKIAARQQALRELLPQPIKLQPEEGDLIIINSGRPHAVRGFNDGYRATFQTFILYMAGKPLKLMC
jgi:hypothetical protein